MIILVIYLFRVLTSVDKFEDVNKSLDPTADQTTLCPSNSVLLMQFKIPLVNSNVNWACYSGGVTNIDGVFQTNDTNIVTKINYPAGSSVSLYSGINATGNKLITLNDTNSSGKLASGINQYINFIPLFASIQISTAQGSVISPTIPSGTCPSLSPAAIAVANAADAQHAADKAKAADIAAVATKAVTDNLIPKMASINGINIQCPSGLPIINGGDMRNTKFSPSTQNSLVTNAANIQSNAVNTTQPIDNSSSKNDEDICDDE